MGRHPVRRSKLRDTEPPTKSGDSIQALKPKGENKELRRLKRDDGEVINVASDRQEEIARVLYGVPPENRAEAVAREILDMVRPAIKRALLRRDTGP